MNQQTTEHVRYLCDRQLHERVSHVMTQQECCADGPEEGCECQLHRDKQRDRWSAVHYVRRVLQSQIQYGGESQASKPDGSTRATTTSWFPLPSLNSRDSWRFSFSRRRSIVCVPASGCEAVSSKIKKGCRCKSQTRPVNRNDGGLSLGSNFNGGLCLQS
jgi:hypothetical protein